MSLSEKIDKSLKETDFNLIKHFKFYFVLRIYALLSTWIILQYLYDSSTIKTLISILLDSNTTFKNNTNLKDLFLYYVLILITLNYIPIFLPKLFMNLKSKISLFEFLGPLFFYLVIVFLFNINFNVSILAVTTFISSFSIFFNILFNSVPPVFSSDDFLTKFWQKLSSGYKRLHYIIFGPAIIYTILMLISFLEKSIFGGMDSVKDYWYCCLIFIIIYIVIIWVIDGFINDKK